MAGDFRLEDHGSLVLIRPMTPRGHEAVEAVLESNAEAMTFGGALVVEPRYVQHLLHQLAGDFGTEVE